MQALKSRLLLFPETINFKISLETENSSELAVSVERERPRCFSLECSRTNENYFIIA